MTKISCIMLTYNDEICIDMSLESALSFADEVVVLDGGSTDKTVSIIKQFQEKNPGKINYLDGLKVCPEAYEEQLKDDYGRVLQNGNFGMMRQCLVDNASGDWIFMLDSDEAVSDNAREELIRHAENKENFDIFDVPYIHFVGDFKHIDNSEAIHVGISRFFKKIDGIKFSRYNHALPEGNFTKKAAFHNVNIFHLGYAMNLFDIWVRYKRNMLKSEIHFGINQCFWRDWHYFNYPKTESHIHPSKLPKAIQKRFDIGRYH